MNLHDMTQMFLSEKAQGVLNLLKRRGWLKKFELLKSRREVSLHRIPRYSRPCGFIDVVWFNDIHRSPSGVKFVAFEVELGDNPIQIVREARWRYGRYMFHPQLGYVRVTPSNMIIILVVKDEYKDIIENEVKHQLNVKHYSYIRVLTLSEVIYMVRVLVG